MEKSGDPDTTGRGCKPRKSQHSLYQNVSCIARIVIFILNSPSCVLSAVVSSKAAGIDCGQQRGKKYSFSFSLSRPWQSSIQDWGEEVEEGAVYHVTLKRVQIQQAANKGARWLGVSKAGEMVNFGISVSVVL